MNKSNSNIKVGEIYLINFPGVGSAQSGLRPGIIIQNNLGNKHSPNVVAIPITSVIKNAFQPTHILLNSKDTGLKYNSMALCESVECVPKINVDRYLTTLNNYQMSRVAKAFLIAYPVLAYLDIDGVKYIYNKTKDVLVA